MIESKRADALAVGDVLSTSGAKVTEVVPSHHGRNVYLRTRFEDGYTQTVTVEADVIVHVWTPDQD